MIFQLTMPFAVAGKSTRNPVCLGLLFTTTEAIAMYYVLREKQSSSINCSYYEFMSEWYFAFLVALEHL